MEKVTTKSKFKCPWVGLIIAGLCICFILIIVYLGVYHGCTDWERIKSTVEPLFAGLGGFSGLGVLIGTLVKCGQNKNLTEACATLDKAVKQINKAKKKPEPAKN